MTVIQKSAKAMLLADWAAAVDLRAFDFEDKHVARLVQVLLDLLQDGDTVHAHPEAIAARMQMSRAGYYRVFDAAVALGLVSRVQRARVGTVIRLHLDRIRDVAAMARQVRDMAVRASGRMVAKFKHARAAVRAALAARFSNQETGYSHGETMITLSKEYNLPDGRSASAKRSYAAETAARLGVRIRF